MWYEMKTVRLAVCAGCTHVVLRQFFPGINPRIWAAAVFLTGAIVLSVDLLRVAPTFFESLTRAASSLSGFLISLLWLRREFLDQAAKARGDRNRCPCGSRKAFRNCCGKPPKS